jgi:hypothetical protein
VSVLTPSSGNDGRARAVDWNVSGCVRLNRLLHPPDREDIRHEPRRDVKEQDEPEYPLHELPDRAERGSVRAIFSPRKAS